MLVATNRRREQLTGAGTAENGPSPVHGAVFGGADAVGNLFGALAVGQPTSGASAGRGTAANSSWQTGTVWASWLLAQETSA
jgi:hypothetical protein